MRNDDEITSDELDELLDTAPTLSAVSPSGETEVWLNVAVNPQTLRELEQRAVAPGTDLNAAAAEALRAGAHAA